MSEIITIIQICFSLFYLFCHFVFVVIICVQAGKAFPRFYHCQTICGPESDTYLVSIET